MRRYNPDKAPNADEWLALSEGERIDLAEEYHRRKKIRIPGARAHAAFHAIVENQLAMGEQAVIETFDRLQDEGLSRHDAIHAIATVLAGITHGIMTKSLQGDVDVNEEYHNRLRVYTAEAWRASG